SRITPDLAVDLLHPIVDRGPLSIEPDRSLMKVPFRAFDGPVREILDSLRAVREIAEHLEPQLFQRRNRVRAVRYRQRKRPKRLPSLSRGTADDFQVFI